MHGMAFCPILVVESPYTGAGDIASCLVGYPGNPMAVGGRDDAIYRYYTDGQVFQAPSAWKPISSSCPSDWTKKVLHLHGPFHRSESLKTVIGILTKRGRDFAVVVSLNGWLGPDPTERNSIRIRLRRRKLINCLQAADAILCINAFEADHVRKLGINNRVEVAPPGIDFQAYACLAEEIRGRSSEVSERKATVLVPAPIHPAEGLVPLLKALAMADQSTPIDQVVLMGRECGDWRKMIEAAVRRKGGIDRVQFVTEDSLDTQMHWLCKATIVVVPSLRSRPPAAVLQAIACGLPVVCTRAVMPANAQPFVTVADPTSESLAKAIATTIGEHQSIPQNKRAHNRELAAKTFDWPARANHWQQIIETIR
jgi:glycosyltransferase involved in cell wall biosynthesis